MLAKKGWRLSCDLKSLWALLSGYGKLFNAKLKGGSSCTWQSVLPLLECSKKGYIWQVRDRLSFGKTIGLISWSQNLKIQMPPGNDIIKTIDELINPTDGTWDATRVNDFVFAHWCISRKGRFCGMTLEQWWFIFCHVSISLSMATKVQQKGDTVEN